MIIHSSIIKDEVKKLEHEMSVEELMDHIPHNSMLQDIQIILEEIARNKIVNRGEDYE